jgi:hypothetical protein
MEPGRQRPRALPTPTPRRPPQVERLLAPDSGIVKHRGKIVSAINNARRAPCAQPLLTLAPAAGLGVPKAHALGADALVRRLLTLKPPRTPHPTQGVCWSCGGSTAALWTGSGPLLALGARPSSTILWTWPKYHPSERCLRHARSTNQPTNRCSGQTSKQTMRLVGGRRSKSKSQVFVVRCPTTQPNPRHHPTPPMRPQPCPPRACGCQDGGVRAAQQGAESGGLHVCGPHHGLLVHAGVFCAARAKRAPPWELVGGRGR